MPMPNKNKKRNTAGTSPALPPGLTTRAMAPIVPASYDAEAGTVRAIATTEAPAQVWDWEQYDVVDEVLRMDGVVLPASGQVPLLDSHNRYSVADVLGSAADFDIDDEAGGHRAMACTVSYSSTPEGESAKTKTGEGHLTDYSVGYRIEESYWVPDGQKQIIGDTEYEGPVRVVTRWTLKELSTTPIGADELAKARQEAQPRGHQHIQPKELFMDPKLFSLLVGKGLAADASSEDAWAYFQKLGLAEQRSLMDQAAGTTAPPAEPPPADSPPDAEAIRAAAAKEERERCSGIRNRCRSAGLEDTVADDMIERGITLESAGNEIFQRMEQANPPLGARTQFSMGPDERDKFRAAAGDALLIRCGIAVEQPAPGCEEFRGATLIDLGRTCLERAGVRTRGMSRNELVDNILAVRAIGATSTSDFPYLLSGLVNKRLLGAYAEAPATWRPWVNVVSAQDFKAQYGVSLSGSPGLELIGENGEYKDTDFAENQESYFVKSYGRITYLTRKMIINDDTRAFERIPKLFGSAARRKEADLVYVLITGNPTMNDGVALFHNNHKNLAGTGGVVGLDTLKAGRTAMRKQTGLKGETLDIIPAFLLVPVAQETESEIILRSAALPDDDKSSGVYNPWQGKLTPIAEPRLDAVSANAWYLVGDPAQVDTVEVAYLDGNEQPYVAEQPLFEREAIGIKVRHDFGCGVMDHVGFYKNAGA